jgi:hypothetical protein
MTTFRDHKPVTPGAQAFLEGRSNTLTSADVDPQGAEAFTRYEKAMSLKASGDLSAAAALLELSCSPPSIYKGHYRELFKIWRQLNRAATAEGQHRFVIDRVRKMALLDEELIREMLKHWGEIQQRSLPADYFDSDRNLLVSDAKALKKAAEACKDDNSIALAKALLSRLSADA